MVYFILFCRGHRYAQFHSNHLSTMLLREEFSSCFFCFQNTDNSNVLLSIAACLDAQILQEGKWHSRWHAADLQRWRNSSEMPEETETTFPVKVPVYWRVGLCFWPHIVFQCSYLTLALVRCGIIQTIFKDLTLPYPSSRDYKCLEDYLHCQMKE